MIRNRYRPQDNPAWPGLVDLFAFTLVIFIALTARSSGEDKYADFEEMSYEEQLEYVESLNGRIDDLMEERDDVDSEFAELQEKAADLRAEIDNKKQESEALEEERERLAEMLTKSKHLNDDLAQQAEDAKESLRAEARTRVVRLREELQSALGEDWGALDPVDDTLPEFEIRSFRGRQVKFQSGKYELETKQKDDIVALRLILVAVLASYQDAQIEVSGTSDPDPLNGQYQIRDNIDLSAMRASTVAKLLKSEQVHEAPPIDNKVLIIGLGEEGRPIEDKERRKIEYQNYRTVRLKIRIPIDSEAVGT